MTGDTPSRAGVTPPAKEEGLSEQRFSEMTDWLCCANEEAHGLSFHRLRSVNVRRCVKGFGHTLESWSPAEWTNAMCGEAGEAANVAKKMLRHRDNVAGNTGEDRDLAALREKLARELADVVIYADLCAAAQGIDLAAAVRETFNRKSEQIGSDERLD